MMAQEKGNGNDQVPDHVPAPSSEDRVAAAAGTDPIVVRAGQYVISTAATVYLVCWSSDFCASIEAIETR